MNIFDIGTEFCMDFVLINQSIVKPLSVICSNVKHVIAVDTRDLVWNIKEMRGESGAISSEDSCSVG
jgi:hypothetical protein